MVDTLGTDLQRSLESGSIKPVWKVEIIADPAKTYQWVSGDRPLFGWDPIVSSVGPISARLDPISRQSTVGSVEIVVLDDGVVRDAMSTYDLFGKQVDVFLATEGASTDFIRRFRGVVTDVMPSENGKISIRVEDARDALKATAYDYVFEGASPWDVLSTMIDLALGDSSSVSTPSDKTHWLTSISSDDQNTWSPVKEKQVRKGEPWVFGFDEMLFLTGGAYVMRPSTGEMIYKAYDRDASAVRTLGVSDIQAMIQKESRAYRYNKFSTPLDIVTESKPRPDLSPYGPRLTGDVSVEDGKFVTNHVYSQSDTGARERAGISSSHPRTLEYKFNSRLAHNFASIIGANGDLSSFAHVSTATGQTIILSTPTSAGITGAASTLATTLGGSCTLTAPLDSSHLAYFLILVGNHVNETSSFEIASANSCAVFSPTGEVRNSPNGGHTGFYPSMLSYTLNARGLFGTTAQAFDTYAFTSADDYGYFCWAVDITQQVEICQRNLTRFMDGIMIVEASVDPRHMDLELADVVSFSDDVPLGFGLDGLSSAQTFEVIGREELIDADPPHLRITAALLKTGVSVTANPLYELQSDKNALHNVISSSLLNPKLFGTRFFRIGGLGTLV